MIEYKKCSEVNKDQIFEAFKEGFSDYMIKFDITSEKFFNLFFPIEGNSFEHSHIAIDNQVPIGLVLGGIRTYDGLKTIRCGTMCVIPNYRGKGVSQKLIELHESTARENECDQMFLECIVGNDRALKFYRNNNYYKVYDLLYFSKKGYSNLDSPSEKKVEEIDMNSLKKLRQSLDTHINWQNEMEVLEQLDPDLYGIKEKGKLVAAIATRNKRINFLYVKKEYRNRGFARALIKRTIVSPDDKITANFTNNASLEGYYRHLGFSSDPINQVEMYKDIKY